MLDSIQTLLEARAALLDTIVAFALSCRSAINDQSVDNRDLTS